jgi:hypothetical protein
MSDSQPARDERRRLWIAQSESLVNPPGYGEGNGEEWMPVAEHEVALAAARSESAKALSEQICADSDALDGMAAQYVAASERAEKAESALAAARQVTDEKVNRAAEIVSQYVGTRVDVDPWSVARAALLAALNPGAEGAEG